MATSPQMAYLISQYPAVSHTFILREVVELRRMGFRIDVASINDPDRSDERLTAEERAEAGAAWYVKAQGASGALRATFVTLLLHPAGFLRGACFALRLGGSFFYFIEALMIGRWMEKTGQKHLHVHFATPASTVGLLLTRIFPFTLSITVHGPDEFYDVPGYHLQRKIAESRLLCAIGMFARSQLMKIAAADHWSKIRVTPLGVDPEIFSPRPFRESVDCFEVLCVGRLVPAKGQRILVAAIARLVAEGRSVRLRIVGEGPDRASLEAEVRALSLNGTVIFEGAVNQDRIRDLYRSAEVFALASFAEGIPVVLMEAMAMEIPCVTTFITGIPELIRSEVDGLLVPPSDEAALARAIARLMDDAGLRRRIGKSGRLRVIENYNLRRNVEGLAEVFREMLAA